MYQGATTHSNNAAEMTGLLRAIQGEAGEVGVTVLKVDSKYAIHMATGRTRPRSGPKAVNRELALRLRDAYRATDGCSTREGTW